MDGRGLLFSGEFITSANVTALLPYNSSSEGASICIVPIDSINATMTL